MFCRSLRTVSPEQNYRNNYKKLGPLILHYDLAVIMNRYFYNMKIINKQTFDKLRFKLSQHLLLMDTFSMHKQTLLKTNPLSQQAFAYLQDKKKQLIFIAEPKAIHVYNVGNQKFQDDIKSPTQSGPISCITTSDQLFFFAYGMHIAASTPAGKIVFDFDTYIASDKIDRIHVLGYFLWVFSGNLLNQFVMAGSQLSNKLSRKGVSPASKTQDANSIMFEAKVNDSLAVQDQFSKHFIIILKNNNQVACVQDKQTASFKTTSPPTTIIQYPKSKTNRYLIGTMSGELLHLQITRKQIKQIWVIKQNSKGKINNLLEVKNQSIFVFRDSVIEIWGQDKMMLASQQTQQKYISSIYLFEKQILMTGSLNGNLIQMRDYMKMAKDYDKKNQVKLKQNLQKEIANLKAEYENLKSKSLSNKNGNKVIKSEGISVQTNITIDYQYSCSCLELKSESKIIKIILKGKFTIIKCTKLIFSQKDMNDEFIYVFQQQELKNTKIWFKSEQKFERQQKMKIMVYGNKDNKTYGISKVLDLKPLCYHHKIPMEQLKGYNVLKISGQFKYFEMNMYFNSIFNEFGSASQDGNNYSDAFYQSILSKQKIRVMYKNGQCQIHSISPAPLIVIKHFLVENSKQKHLSYAYSVQLNHESIRNMVNNIGKMIKPLQQIKRQAQLIPGLMQIKNEQNLSQDLRGIIQKSEQIAKKQKQSQTQYENLIGQLREAYISYQKLKQHEVTAYELDAFNRQVLNFDGHKIISMILA